MKIWPNEWARMVLAYMQRRPPLPRPKKLGGFSLAFVLGVLNGNR